MLSKITAKIPSYNQIKEHCHERPASAPSHPFPPSVHVPYEPSHGIISQSINEDETTIFQIIYIALKFALEVKDPDLKTYFLDLAKNIMKFGLNRFPLTFNFLDLNLTATPSHPSTLPVTRRRIKSTHHVA